MSAVLESPAPDANLAAKPMRRPRRVAGTIDTPEALHQPKPTGHAPQGCESDHVPAATFTAAPISPSPRVHGSIAEAVLRLLAENHTDFERIRIATQNRLRSLRQVYLIEEGVDTPEVVRLGVTIEMMEKLEHAAELDLCRALRAHPLGPWVKRTIGIGEKQGARLIAAIGDPYWNTLHDRPRTVSELWAYCGYHVLRTGHSCSDAQRSSAGPDPLTPSHDPAEAHKDCAGGHSLRTDHLTTESHDQIVGAESSSNPGHPLRDTQTGAAGVAPSRKKGQKANWSSDAKMRAFLCAESCIKQARSPYRTVYDAGRAKYAEALHPAECRRCGPTGKPAQPGSPLSAGHQHARALRLVVKTILRDLWLEAREVSA